MVSAGDNRLYDFSQIIPFLVAIILSGDIWND